jgi:hypothetical protein
MIVTLLIWLYAAWLCFAYGWGFLFLLSKLLKETEFHFKLPIILITGLCVLTVLSEYESLGIKIDLAANLTLMAGAILLSILFISQKDYQQFEKTVGTKPWRIFSGIVFALIVISLLEVSTHTPSNADTGIYHAQAIRWIETFRVVPGLGNLHGRLAFDSAWLVLSALFSFSFLGGLSYHQSGSIIFLFSLLYFWSGFTNLLSGKFKVSSMIKTALIPIAFITLAIEASSPGTDLPVSFLIWIILLFWLEAVENQNTGEIWKVLVIFLAVVTVTIKLSAAPLLLCLIPFIYFWIKKQNIKPLPIALAISGLAVLPWLVRNVILSGYLVYPVSALDLFSPDWKIPKSLVDSESQAVIAWGRHPGWGQANVFALSFQQWVHQWFINQTINRKVLFLLTTFSPLWFFMSSFLKRYHPKETTPTLPIFITAYCGYIFWFFTAPDFRFGYGFIIFICLLTVIEIIRALPRINISINHLINPLLILSMLVFQGWFLARSFHPRDFSSRIIFPMDYKHLPTQPCQLDNLTIFCASQYYECWYDPFPCNPYPPENIELRGPTLQDGFHPLSVK